LRKFKKNPDLQMQAGASSVSSGQVTGKA